MAYFSQKALCLIINSVVTNVHIEVKCGGKIHQKELKVSPQQRADSLGGSAEQELATEWTQIPTPGPQPDVPHD